MKLEKILMVLLAHRIIAYGVNYDFKNAEGLSALEKRFWMPF